MSYGIERFFLLSYCLACCWPGLGAKSDLRVIRQWSELFFNYPSHEAQQKATEKRFYVPGNSIPIDVDVHHRHEASSRIFVTIPRFDEGRPMTLATVDDKGKLSAYPDYSWHDNQYSNCNGLISVFRVAVDECSRLWVLDTGKIGDSQICPPQIVAFDLNTDRVQFRYRFNESIYTSSSLFITPVVDVQDKQDCSGTFVYVADVSGFGLVVVDVDRKRGWRVNHRLFFPYPSRGSITVDGESFDLMDGVIGMALSPMRQGYERYLYFHALASTTENVVRTSVLKNDSFVYNSDADPQAINVFPSERPSQSAAQAMDRDGIMYFGLMEPPSIWCWNTATEFNPMNFHQIAMNKETLQFASGVKVVNNVKGEQELWVLTSSFQRVMTGSINSNQVNFRIHAEKIQKLLENSQCAKTPADRTHGYHANEISSIVYPRVHNRYGAFSQL